MKPKEGQPPSLACNPVPYWCSRTFPDLSISRVRDASPSRGHALSVAAVVLPIEKGIFEGLIEAESSSSLPNSSGTGAASVSNPNPGAFLLTIRSVVCVQTVPILAWLLDTTPPARSRCNRFVSRPGTDTFFVCASPLLCAASFLHRQEPRASGGDGGRLGHDQVHHDGPAEPIGVAGRPLDSRHPALGHHPQRASAVLTSPLPMQALSVRLVPAAVAVSRRGKRTDWACASVLYGAVDFFGGE